MIVAERARQVSRRSCARKACLSGRFDAHLLLDFQRDAARALVKDRVLRRREQVVASATEYLQGIKSVRETHFRPVVEEPGGSDSLLVAAAESIRPVLLGIPAAFAVDDASELDDSQAGQQISVGPAGGSHLGWRVRVDDLVSQRAERQVRPLGDVRKVVRRRLVDGPTENGPEAAENPEHRALTAAVRANNEQVVAPLDAERHGFDLPSVAERVSAGEQYREKKGLRESRTKMSPFGETIGTSSKTISSASMTCPRPCRTVLRKRVNARSVSGGSPTEPRLLAYAPFAFSSTEADETSFFWNRPSLTSSIVEIRSSTRAV